MFTDYNKTTCTGADIVIHSLKELGIDTIFGYPGGAVLPIYDSLFKLGGLRHILVRHEQGAIHAAQAYSRTTGKLGVVLVTSGPGATNIVTGVADAFLDSTPVLVITGQVPTYMIGTDAFQEVDITSITRQITKQNYLITKTEDINRTFKEAAYIAKNGRHGPVLIDIPKDLQNKTITYTPQTFVPMFEQKYNTQYSAQDITKASELIISAKKPVIYVGGGLRCTSIESMEKLRQIVHHFNIPVCSTTMGLGGYDSTDPHFIGLAGMHGTLEANNAIYNADLLLAIGVRFGDRVTSIFKQYSPNSRRIHVDIDASSVNKNVKSDIGLIGNAESVLNDLSIALLAQKHNTLQQWWSEIKHWQDQRCLEYKVKQDEFIKPQYVIEQISKILVGKDAVVTTDVGQHQMWAAQYFKFTKPHQFISSLGLGTMGFGLPAAIGSKIARPELPVVCVSGDGSIMMNIQELATAVEYKVGVKVVVLNNDYLGMVKQWQDTFYENRYSQSRISQYTDFCKIANGFGVNTFRATNYQELEEGLRLMFADDKPFLLDVVISKDETVYSTNLIPQPHNIVDSQKTFLISTFAYNDKGVLARICNMLSSSMYNIETLSAGEIDGYLSFVNVIVSGGERLMNSVKNSILKITPVVNVDAIALSEDDIKQGYSFFIASDDRYVGTFPASVKPKESDQRFYHVFGNEKDIIHLIDSQHSSIVRKIKYS